MLALGLLIPFAGTLLGSATVFLMRNKINERLEKILLGFASGVMIAASVWSLLIPSIEQSGGKALRFLPAAVGFLSGIAFLLILDTVIPHLHIKSNSEEGINTGKFSKTAMLIFAVTLHNIPEGMAVGVALAAAMGRDSGITLASSMALSLGIAIQNFPEGAIISMPLKSNGAGKLKAFALGGLSGAVEPVFGLITLLITSAVITALPYLLAFAAGAMIYVVIEELIPESQTGKHSNSATVGAALGFVLMMALDVQFG
ncbi:MAG: ZIP family metal transporter [Ruminococcaceae bacterium]|nr:ZIP family metal transporter [Oscillospiraceae bacterium]